MSKLTRVGVAQKGFTLIEMSIVLVIIGLIIGGILKGQEIIESSRQKNLVTQIDGLRSAVNTFNDRYSTLPGDYAFASTRIAALLGNGDANGVVGTNQTTFAALLTDVGQAATAAGATASGSGENSLFFCHLVGAGLLGNSSSDCTAATTSFGGSSPLPATAFPNVGFTVAYGLEDSGGAIAPVTSLWLRVHRAAGVAVAAATSGALSGKTMFQIDSKYDDGLPATGTFRSAFAGTNASCPIAAANSAYLPMQETPECVLLVNMVR